MLENVLTDIINTDLTKPNGVPFPEGRMTDILSTIDGVLTER